MTPRSLDEHLSSTTSRGVIDAIVRRTGVDGERIAKILSTYAAEARYGYDLISPLLRRNERILEVGSGLCMLSSFLRLQAHNVTALEPCSPGFDLFSEIQVVLLEHADAHVPIYHIKAEDLCPKHHGAFDFIFSINVLEHIPDLRGAIRAMASVLAPQGRMWHTCPNYAVPYEPHFGVPLLPFFPRATGLLLPKRITEGELWRDLNFVTYFGLRRIARANNLIVTFSRKTMASALNRLESDAEFASRQRGIASTAHRVLKATGLLPAIGAIPPALSTPMMVEMVKARLPGE